MKKQQKQQKQSKQIGILATALAALTVLAGACSSPRTATPAATPVATPVATDPALAKRLDAVIDKALAAQQVVGTVVVIARDGKIVYARGAGLADREAKLPVREDTQFRLASMTKPIVSVAALALIDQGKLSLEDPVTKFLPDFRPKLADGREPVITVRHLITHTAGLTYKFFEPADGPYHKAEVSDGLAEPGLAADVNLRRLASAPLLHEPGTAWSYSLAIDVLGEVVARAGGGPLPKVVEQVVTRPLGMTDTVFTVTDRPRLAWPYAATGTPPVRMTDPFDLPNPMSNGVVRFSPARIFDPASFPSGGAGMAGTARDYLRFAEALRTGGAPILKPETVRAMSSDQIGERAGQATGPGSRFGFGFGVIVDPAAAKSPRSRGSYGWAGIYGTNFWIDPVAQLSVVILTNVTGDTPFVNDLEQAIYATGP
ncbi:MAG TPA: serine hydrolase domain-containing protein [Kofleriaceae bacterium]|nr:serine hydrolase domain-containing protein [Kofleriaceae bacterium]